MYIKLNSVHSNDLPLNIFDQTLKIPLQTITFSFNLTHNISFDRIFKRTVKIKLVVVKSL